LIHRVYEKYSYDKRALKYEESLVEKLYVLFIGRCEKSEGILRKIGEEYDEVYKELVEGVKQKSVVLESHSSKKNDSPIENPSLVSNDTKKGYELIALNFSKRDIDKTLSRIKKNKSFDISERFKILTRNSVNISRDISSLVAYGIRNGIPKELLFSYSVEGGEEESVVIDTGIDDMENFKLNFENVCEFFIGFFECLYEEQVEMLCNIQNIEVYNDLPHKN